MEDEKALEKKEKGRLVRLWMEDTFLFHRPLVLQTSVCFSPGRSTLLVPRISLGEARPDDRPWNWVWTMEPTASGSARSWSHRPTIS